MFLASALKIPDKTILVKLSDEQMSKKTIQQPCLAESYRAYLHKANNIILQRKLVILEHLTSQMRQYE